MSTFDRLKLYTPRHTRSMPFPMDTHGCLGTFAKTHLVKHLGIRHTGAYQKGEFTAGPAGFKMETPETEFIGVHTCSHIYTVQVG